MWPPCCNGEKFGKKARHCLMLEAARVELINIYDSEEMEDEGC